MNIDQLLRYQDAVYYAIIAQIQASYTDILSPDEQFIETTDARAEWILAARRAKALILDGVRYK